MRQIEVQKCSTDAGVRHSSLLYTKIARMSKFSSTDIVAGPILEPTPNESAVEYRRVRRALVLEAEKGDPNYVEGTKWPTKTVVVI